MTGTASNRESGGEPGRRPDDEGGEHDADVVHLALLLFRFQAPRSSMDPFSREALSTHIINIAHIRVAGVGGLGLVAMALVVAWFLPRVWQHLRSGRSSVSCSRPS